MYSLLAPCSQNICSNGYFVYTMNNLVDIITDSTEYLDTVKNDPSITKDDVCDTMRNRMCVMLSKLISYPLCTNFSMPITMNINNSDDNEMLKSFFLD